MPPTQAQIERWQGYFADRARGVPYTRAARQNGIEEQTAKRYERGVRNNIGVRITRRVGTGSSISIWVKISAYFGNTQTSPTVAMAHRPSQPARRIASSQMRSDAGRSVRSSLPSGTYTRGSLLRVPHPKGSGSSVSAATVATPTPGLLFNRYPYSSGLCV